MRYISLAAVLSFCFLAHSCQSGRESVYEDCLDRLDSTLELTDEYVRAKEQRISSIENMLHSRGVTPLQQSRYTISYMKNILPFSLTRQMRLLIIRSFLPRNLERGA